MRKGRANSACLQLGLEPDVLGWFRDTFPGLISWSSWSINCVWYPDFWHSQVPWPLVPSPLSLDPSPQSFLHGPYVPPQTTHLHFKPSPKWTVVTPLDRSILRTRGSHRGSPLSLVHEHPWPVGPPLASPAAPGSCPRPPHHPKPTGDHRRARMSSILRSVSEARWGSWGGVRPGSVVGGVHEPNDS